MALATGPIPRVALDEIIEENWGDSVAQSLNNLSERRSAGNWKPSSEIETPTGGSMTVWFNYGGSTGTDLTVPDWATSASVRVELNGVRNEGTPNATYDIQMVLGGEEGRIIRMTATSDAGWFPIGWTDRISSPPTGARKLSVQVAKVSGGGHWSIDADSDIAFEVIYGGAINFYPGL